MPQVARWLLLASSAAAQGCSEPARVIGDACEPDVTITVLATTLPEFQWAPACDVGTVYVITEFGSPMWQISSTPQADFTPTNHIHAGVVYGTVPSTAHQFGDLVPLVPGQTYRVALKVTDSEGEPTQVGDTSFVGPGDNGP